MPKRDTFTRAEIKQAVEASIAIMLGVSPPGYWVATDGKIIERQLSDTVNNMLNVIECR